MAPDLALRNMQWLQLLVLYINQFLYQSGDIAGFLNNKSGAVAYFSKPNLEPLPVSQSRIWTRCLLLKAKSGAIAYF